MEDRRLQRAYLSGRHAGDQPGVLPRRPGSIGASKSQQIWYVTLPLLSPTTFFLILVTTIGTLQAFTQFFLLRRPGAYDAVDTINIYIFNEVRTDSPDFGYGSALAFVLFAVILILTIVQNRVVGRRVFHG
ncbi:MAG: sugar ABC transporter permease [Blastochloris sp.]|nr:sugar ABC transporter permease [Blastochloris sp.]